MQQRELSGLTLFDTGIFFSKRVHVVFSPYLEDPEVDQTVVQPFSSAIPPMGMGECTQA
jgi:hypothetical protein